MLLILGSYYVALDGPPLIISISSVYRDVYVPMEKRILIRTRDYDDHTGYIYKSYLNGCIFVC